MPDYLPIAVGNYTPRTVVDDDGALWYSLADVASMLRLPSSSWAAKRLPEDECRRAPFAFPGSGGAKLLLVSEAGLWRLVMTSKDKSARVLQKWLLGVVMPAIRKDGSYKAPTDQKTQRVRPDARLLAVVAQALKGMLSEQLQLQGHTT